VKVPLGKARLRALGRFAARWGAVFAFLAGGGASVCPSCGSSACPVGFAGAGILGFLVTALLYVPRWVAARVRNRSAGRSEPAHARGDKMKLSPAQISKACKIGECSPK